MVKGIMKDFKPVQFDIGKVHIAGGYTTRPMPVVSRSVADQNGNNITFVKLSSNEPWLRASTTGDKKWKTSTSMCRTSLLQVLHDKINNICDGTERVRTSDDYDPMNEVGQDDDDKTAASDSIRRKGSKRTHYYKNHASKTVVMVDMPVRCPEEDAACTNMRTLTLYIADRKSIWVALSDVEWAIQYLFVQNHLKGVPLISDDDVGPGAPPTMHPPSPEEPASTNQPLLGEGYASSSSA
jgi:hypothetical protein